MAEHVRLPIHGNVIGGGTWRANEVATMFAGHERNTGVPDADVKRLVMAPGDRRVIDHLRASPAFSRLPRGWMPR